MLEFLTEGQAYYAAKKAVQRREKVLRRIYRNFSNLKDEKLKADLKAAVARCKELGLQLKDTFADFGQKKGWPAGAPILSGTSWRYEKKENSQSENSPRQANQG